MIPSNYLSYDDAVRGEVTDRLDALIERHYARGLEFAAHIGTPAPRRVRYTSEHVQILAERLIMPRTNGTFTGSSDPGELFRLVDALGILPPADRVPCPVPWCAGSAHEHGGDGRPPEEYEHSPAEHDWLAPEPLLYGAFYQVGTTPPFYRLDAEAVHDTPLLTVSEVLALADDFERHAATLRERAAQLAQYGGMQ